MHTSNVHMGGGTPLGRYTYLLTWNDTKATRLSTSGRVRGDLIELGIDNSETPMVVVVHDA